MQHTTEAPKQYQCRHIFTDGRRCASPCLRQQEFCYYHHTTRRPVANPTQRRTRRSTFNLPLPEDRSAIQASIGEVLQRIAANEIDPRRAGLLLYGLQIASLNLPKPPAHRKAKPEPIELVEEITTDPALGILAPRTELSERTERPSVIGNLIMKIMQNDEPAPTERIPQNEHHPVRTPEPATLPTLQAAEDSPSQPNPCNSANPVVALSRACRAATHLRSLPSAIGATQRPAESSHASLKTTKTSESFELPEPQPHRGCGSFLFTRHSANSADSARRGHDVHPTRSPNSIRTRIGDQARNSPRAQTRH